MKKSVLKKPFSVKDVFGAFLVRNAVFSKGVFDMPVVRSNVDSLPVSLVSYQETGRKKSGILPGTALHFYIYDYRFDGRYGIWNTLISGVEYSRGFNLSKLEGFDYIIAPDYSLYLDMPRAWQIWNVYRSRVAVIALQEAGFKVIVNVRWTDQTSYDFCFEGIDEGSVVAIGSYGCSKSLEDRILFDSGLEEMIRRIHPETILFYGTVTDSSKQILDRYNQHYKVYKPDITIAMEEVIRHGDEG